MIFNYVLSQTLDLLLILFTAPLSKNALVHFSVLLLFPLLVILSLPLLRVVPPCYWSFSVSLCYLSCRPVTDHAPLLIMSTDHADFLL